MRTARWRARSMRAPLVFKKLDSTLRGPVAAEVRAALEGSGRRAAVVAPAFPAGGRTTRGGVQHVDGRPVDATAFRDDPSRPVREADMRRLLAAAGAGPVALLSRADLGDPARIAAAVRAHTYVVADAEDDADLAALVRGVPDPADVLWVGSAGLAGALAACHPGPRPPARSSARAVAGAPVLAAIGSAHPATAAQVARLAARPDVAEVPLSLDLLARGDHAAAVAAAVEDAARALAHGRSVVVHVASAPGPPRRADLADRIPRALAAVAERLAAAAEIGGLVLSGGETAVCVGRALGARGLLLDEELEPGVPVGRLLGPRPFRGRHQGGRLRRARHAGAGRRGARRTGRDPCGGGVSERVVAVTMGDPAGVGPEIVAKVFAEPATGRAIVVGDPEILGRAIGLLDLPLDVNVVEHPREAAFDPGAVDVVAASELPGDLPFGALDARAGDAAYRYVRRAVELALAGDVHAIATAPLNKEAMHLAGHRYPGHTELLAELCGVEDYAMMLVTEDLRVVHVSTHVSLQEAIRRVAPERELTVIRLADESLRRLGFDRPRVAVAGLNPHAGESGLFGAEDAERIAPAVRAAQEEGIDASGPWPPDTVFMQARTRSLRRRRGPVPRPGPHPDQAPRVRHGRERDRRAPVLPHQRRPRDGLRHRRHREGRGREHARGARPRHLARPSRCRELTACGCRRSSRSASASRGPASRTSRRPCGSSGTGTGSAAP